MPCIQLCWTWRPASFPSSTASRSGSHSPTRACASADPGDLVVVHSHAKLVDDRQAVRGPTTSTSWTTKGTSWWRSPATLCGRSMTRRATLGVAVPKREENFCVEMDVIGSLSMLLCGRTGGVSPDRAKWRSKWAAAGLNFIEVLTLRSAGARGWASAGRPAGASAGSPPRGSSMASGLEMKCSPSPAFSRFTTTAASSAALKPDHLSVAEAATLPAAYATAYYSLITVQVGGWLVRLDPCRGRGVGFSAAINIATWRGAEDLRHRRHARAEADRRSLGIRHVWDSRSLDFAPRQAMEATGGRGVDVVLKPARREIHTGHPGRARSLRSVPGAAARHHSRHPFGPGGLLQIYLLHGHRRGNGLTRVPLRRRKSCMRCGETHSARCLIMCSRSAGCPRLLSTWDRANRSARSW